MGTIPGYLFRKSGMLFIALILAFGVSHAQEVTWEVTGTLTDVNTSGGFITEFPNAAVGTPFTLSWTFDAASIPSSTTAGLAGIRYRYGNTLSNVELSVGGDVLGRSQQGFQSLDIWDDYIPLGSADPAADGYNVIWGVNSPQGGFAQLSVAMRGPEDLTVFNGPGLPNLPPAGLASLSTQVIQLVDGADSIIGSIDNVSIRQVQPQRMQLNARGTSFFSNFSVVFDDTGDGLLQFEEIVSFSGTSGISTTGQQLTYTGIAYVPDIPGFATASGVLNPAVPCPQCWELTPSNFGDPSDGWFTTRWEYTLSQSPGTNTFSSTVTNAFGPHAGLFNVGDPVDITFFLDQTVIDSNAAADAGRYLNATIQLVTDFPALQTRFQFSGGNVQTFDNTPNPDDQIFIFGSNNDTGATLGGELVTLLEMDFGGTTEMLSSDRLIAGIPPNINNVTVFFSTASGFTQVNIAPPELLDSVTVPADDCTATAGGCNPTGLHEFTLPDGFVPPPGATITQTVYPFEDTRADASGRCDGQTPEILFNGDLIIPGHLCGSPEYRVIVTEANFDILEDTIFNTVFPEEFVSNPIDCQIPIIGDPQLQSAFVWQPDDPADVIEGTAIALTNDCGSSRGRVRGFSFIIVGLHIDFGLDFDADPGAVTQAFIDLTSTKLDNLVTAVFNAQVALSPSNYRILSTLAELAERLHNQGNYQAANRIIEVFLLQTERIAFDTSVGFNHEGNLLSRADHIRFLLEEFIIPFAR